MPKAMTAAEIVGALHGHRSGRGYVARCPAHDDRSPSLSLTERDGRMLVHCHAGCSQRDVIAALRARGLWPEHERPSSTPEDRARWAAERRELQRDLPGARYWRRAAVRLAEETLHLEKSCLFDPTEGAADLCAIRNITGMLTRLRSMGDAALVAYYREWQRDSPKLTWAMVRAGREREAAETRTLCRFMEFPERAATEYVRGAR